MASAGRRDAARLIDRLRDEPQRFELFEAVRLLESFARRAAASSGGAPPEIGGDTPASREPVRLRSHPTLRFPAAQVSAATLPASGAGAGPPELTTPVLGLAGALGALPAHYTELLVKRLRLNDPTLRDFLSLFDHRVLSLFHRAWAKYRLVPSIERAAGARGEDPVTALLRAVAGWGTGALCGRQAVRDAVFVRFGASFGDERRPAATLEAILTDYFGLPARVEPFRIEVLTLQVRDRTRLGAPGRGTGAFNVLGDDAVLGRQAPDACGRFRVRVGPVDHTTYRRFLPDGDLHRPYQDLVRSYVGPSPAFSLRPVLRASEAPPLRLSDPGPGAPLLGWNTWLRSQPIDREFDGVDLELDPRREALLEPLRTLRTRSAAGTH